jgi:hypothetical protein
LGYLQLIKQSDLFILFDDIQYIRHGWINRNRILKPVNNWQYIIAPLQKHEQKSPIKDIQVVMGDAWKTKILRQLEHYKNIAPFYKKTMILVEECLNYEENSITYLNAFYLTQICNYINLPLNLKISSDENFNYNNVNNAGEWALRICEQLNGSTYLNPISGKELFDPQKFFQSKIQLNFLKSGDISYGQSRNKYIEPNLSIIDVLMFNSPEQIQFLLNQYKIEITELG